jgi:hypothetical protein
LISNMLAILGHETILASNGLEAVDASLPTVNEEIQQIRNLDPNAIVVSMSAAAVTGRTFPPRSERFFSD